MKLYLWLTMKFCCSGDHEYMTGTEATALSVLRGMTCRGNSKPLSTVHCTQRRKPPIHTSRTCIKLNCWAATQSTHLTSSPEGAYRRHDVHWLDPPGLPLVVQDVSTLHNLLPVSAEHALQGDHPENEPSLAAGLQRHRPVWFHLKRTLTSSARRKRLSCRRRMYSDFTLLFQQAGPLSRFPVSTMMKLWGPHTTVSWHSKQHEMQCFLIWINNFWCLTRWRSG